VGKLLLGNIRGPQGDNGGPYKTLTSAYGTLDPSGAVTSDTAIANFIEDCMTSGLPGFVPPGTYKITSLMDWRIPGLQVMGSGSNVTKIRQATANTGVVAVAAQGQKIEGFDFGYSSQEVAANTASIGMSLGDDTDGSSFMSQFRDLLFTQCQRGIAVEQTITTKAGLFSCHFDTTRVLGYSYSAIDLRGNNGNGAANATGCVFDNTYIHNNFSGSDANSTWWPVYLQDWDEVVFNQLNIEHAECFNSEPIAFVGVGSAVVNGLHLEHLELSGTPGFGLVYVSHATSALINGLTVRFPTMTGTSYNSVVRLNGTEGPKCEIRGLNEGADGGYATVHPLVDFNSCTNGHVRIKPISKSQHTVAAINAGSGCLVEYEGGWDTYPSLTHAPTGTLGETVPRQNASSSSTGSSGKAYGRVISLRAGQKVSTLTMWTAGAIKTAGTHGWYALLDPATFKVLAATADQTDAATKWGAVTTKYGLNVVSAITVPNDGDYIFAWMVAISGGVMPAFASLVTPGTAPNQEPPILAGVIDNSGTLTTPPSVGSVLGSGTWFAQNTGFNAYATVS
jgi:hypothetical protein